MEQGDQPERRVGRLGLRLALAAAFAAIALLAAGAASLSTERVARAALRDGVTADLGESARSLADQLDAGIYERWQDLELLSRIPAIRDPAATNSERRLLLRGLHAAYPAYALIALITPDGTIVATSDGAGEGQSVAGRDFFRIARERPWFSAEPGSALPLPEDAPAHMASVPSTIDLAIPVRATDGQLVGVMAARLVWPWAAAVQRSVIARLRERRPGAEAFVAGTDGTVLLGPPDWQGRKLPPGLVGATGPGVRTGPWPGEGPGDDSGPRYVTAWTPTQAHRGYPGLGWTVLTREATATAFAPLEVLHDRFLMIGALAALVAATFGWLLAGAVARPLEGLAAMAAGNSAGRRLPPPAAAWHFRETGELARALLDLQQADVRLSESESRFRALIEAVPQLVWSALGDGRLVYANARWRDYTGTEAENWGAVLHPDDRPQALQAWRIARLTGRVFEAEHRLRARDGSYRWFLTRAAPLRGPDGRVTRWFGTCTDIDDAVRARDALAQEGEALERLVAERTAELREREARLAQAQKMEALGRLAGGMAHDFNGVLQVVQSALSLLELRAGQPAEVRRLARLTTDAAEWGTAVTRRLLAFARSSELRPEPVEAGPLLEGVARMLRLMLPAEIAVEVALASGLPPFLADRAQLEIVLVNLASNSRDAMPGGGTLTLSADLAGPDGSRLLLAVRDTGAGMDAATLARATEPFFTTKPVGQGTGLGLSMARGFAEQSGGELHIESKPGAGTVVSLILPAAPGGAAEQGRAAPVSAAASARILLVEDDVVLREVLAASLAEAGHRVTEAGDAAAALAQADRASPPDLLITDLSLPGGRDGIELIRGLRAIIPGLPVLLVTGHVGEETAEGMREAETGGPFAVLGKPFRAEALAAAIARLMG